MKKITSSVILLWFAVLGNAQISTQFLFSKILGDTIEIIHYSDENVENSSKIIYVLDGKKMQQNGLLDSIRILEQSQKIPKYRYVLVSTIVAGIDHRQEYFFCNPKYVEFFEQELIPFIENRVEATERSLWGVSFGALCVAYFSAHTDVFSTFALLSPITYPCKDLNTQMAFSPFRDKAVFISSGINDAEKYVKPLLGSLRAQGHRVKYLQTSGGHDFSNWLEQLEAVFDFFQKNHHKVFTLPRSYCLSGK